MDLFLDNSANMETAMKASLDMGITHARDCRPRLSEKDLIHALGRKWNAAIGYRPFQATCLRQAYGAGYNSIFKLNEARAKGYVK